MDNKLIQISKAVERSTPANLSFVELALQKPIIKYPIKEAENKVMVEAQRAAVLSGQKEISAPDLQIIATEVLERCTQKYPHVTLEEISEAIKNGIYGDYGDYYGLNAKSIFMFIQSYVKSESRINALREHEEEIKLSESKEPKVVTRGQWKELILRDYALLKNGDVDLIVFMPKKYSLLESEGLISLKPETWQNWLERAAESYRHNNTTRKKMKGQNTVANEYKKIFNAAKETGDIPDNEVMHIETHAKEMIYLEYLKKMSNLNIDNFFEQ
jgi:hypothetical protein